MILDLTSSAVTAAGLGLGGAALWLCWMDRRAARWPSVQGVVIRAARPDAPLEDDGSVDIAYRYRVAGVTYEGGRVAYCTRWHGSHKTIERYPVGRRVTVFYDPENPGRALLDRRGGRSAGALAALGAAIAFAASLAPGF